MKYILVFILYLFTVQNIYSQDVKLLFPTTLTKLTPSQSIDILWTNPNSIPVDLFYRIDDGIWNLLIQGATGTNYSWKIPKTTGLNISFKISYRHLVPPELYWQQPEAHTKEIKSGLFTPSGKFFVTSSDDNFLRIWDFEKKELFREVDLNFIGNTHYSVPYNDDIIFVSMDNYIAKIDLKNSNPVVKVLNMGTIVRTLDCTSLKGGLVAATSIDGYVYLFDTELTYLKKYKSKSSPNIYSVRFSRDASMICFSDYDGVIECFDTESDTEILSVSGHGENNQNTVVWSIDISPNNSKLISGGVDASVRVWDIKKENEIKKFINHIGHVRSVRYSADGKNIMSGSLDGKIRHYNGENITEFENMTVDYGNGILSVDYSPDSKYFSASGRGNDFKIWSSVQNTEYENIVIGQIQRKFNIYIPDISVNLNEEFKIPVISSIDRNELTFSKNIYDITLKIEVPVLIVEVEGFNSIPAAKEFDTLDVKVAFDITKDTLTYLNALSLLGPTRSGKFRILSIKTDDELEISTQDGNLTITDECAGGFSRNLIVAGNNPGVKISPNPASDNLNISINIIEDSQYKFELYDIAGRRISQLAEQFLSSGLHELKLNITAINNGVYFLSVKGKKVIFTNEIVIKK